MHVDPVILEHTFLSRPGGDFSLHKELGTLSAHDNNIISLYFRRITYLA